MAHFLIVLGHGSHNSGIKVQQAESVTNCALKPYESRCRKSAGLLHVLAKQNLQSAARIERPCLDHDGQIGCHEVPDEVIIAEGLRLAAWDAIPHAVLMTVIFVVSFFDWRCTWLCMWL